VRRIRDIPFARPCHTQDGPVPHHPADGRHGAVRDRHRALRNL